MNEFNTILSKLDKFIKKYYKNQLIKGLMLGFSLFLSLFLIITLLENFAYFNTYIRAFLFYFYFLVSMMVFIRMIVIPLGKLFKIGKTLSKEDASKLVGKHFPEIKDKLLNVLQLNNVHENQTFSHELLVAGIEQKSKELSPFSFTKAVNFNINKRYLKFLIPPSVIVLVVLFVSPTVLTNPSKRIVNYSTFYEKPAPFQFQILNTKLAAVQQQDFQLNVKITGEKIPDEAFIIIDKSENKLSKESKVFFNYQFKNLRKDVKFQLSANGFLSKEYVLKVYPKPIIVDFELQLDYPAYIGKKSEIIVNSGDLNIPCGTMVTWKIKTRDTKKIYLKLLEKSMFLDPVSSEYFNYKQHFFVSQYYQVLTQNQYVNNTDSLKYFVNVIQDAYPSVEVKEYKDSIYDSHLYFKGGLRDDYGFSKLVFHCKTTDTEQKTEETIKEIDFNKTGNNQEFYYFFDVMSLNPQPGTEIEYYFEIWDNDGVRGSKSSKSSTMILKIPSLDEIDKQTEQNNNDLKKQIEQSLMDINKVQKQIENLDKKMLDKKDLGWQERKQLEDLISKQQQLQLNVEDIKNQINENNIKENQFKQIDESLLEKQKQLEDLFNKIMTDEMKELFKKLQEMLDKLDKNKINETLEKMQLKNKDLEKELDRNLELFKQLEVEKKLNDAIDKLQQLSDEQRKLSEKTSDPNLDKESLIDEQNLIEKKFNELEQELKDIQQKNQELENPEKLLNTEQQQQSINQEMDNSKSNLQNSKMKNAQKSQQNAADQMQKMAEDMKENMEASDAEELGEDIMALRMLLKNLLTISFSEEELINRVKTTNITDPKYIQIMEKQKKLKDDIKMVEDSLFALSKRQPMIEPIVNREISLINDNMDKALKAITDRNTGGASAWQQYIMTSVNNLALLLSESLDQMQQQSRSSSKSCKGGKKCKNPGKGAPSAATMKKLQEDLMKKMKSLKEQMEGGGMGLGGQNMSEQFARMAAEQEALRRIMQQYADELKKDGTGNDGAMSEIMKKMEQTETELVNKILNNETLKRQQEILTRLLESEKADKERELDEKRKSDEGKNKNYSNPNQFFEYKKLKSKEVELIKTIPVTLTPFYKYKTNEYFYNFVD